MEIKTDKTVGYVLLIAGLFLIMSSLYLMFSAFTGISKPPAIFKANNIVISLPKGLQGSLEKVDLLSGSEVSKAMDLVLWCILMLFVSSAGAKIGSLGVQLIREIKVEVKSRG